MTIRARLSIGINDQYVVLYLSKKACQPYIESDDFLGRDTDSIGFFWEGCVISIVFKPVIVLCFLGRLRVGILRFLKMVIMVLI